MDLERLERTIRGEVLRPRDEVYDRARRVWNAMIDRRPAAICRCAGTGDVIEAVRFAREHGLPVAVRGGGHNVAGSAVCDGGLMIDLSPMDDVRVDPSRRTARVGGGATWVDVDRATQAHGLAVPAGVVSTTGVGGLTLGGGFGRLSRKHGLTVDSLLSAEVVTADGERIVAGADRDPELLWGLRGGGGNFGIVTSFAFRLHEVGPEVLFGPIVYRYDDAPEVLRNYGDFAREAPPECCVWVDSLTAPPLPFLPDDVHGTTVLFVAPFWAGDLEAGREALRPLREYGDPLADVVAPTPYTESQRALDDLYGPGMRNYWKSHNLARLSDGAIDVIARFARTAPTPQSDVLISHVGGAIADVAPDDTAYPHRDAAFIVTPGARWDDPGRDAECLAWAREWHEAMAGHASGGSYANFISEGAGKERDAYRGNYKRLAALKRERDPDNLFRLNQNVAPAP